MVKADKCDYVNVEIGRMQSKLKKLQMSSQKREAEKLELSKS